MFEAEIKVTLKKSVLDPQGKAIVHALHSMGFDDVEDVRVGKYFEVQFKNEDRDGLEEKIKTFCDKLLVNPIIETYSYEIKEKAAS